MYLYLNVMFLLKKFSSSWTNHSHHIQTQMVTILCYFGFITFFVPSTSGSGISFKAGLKYASRYTISVLTSFNGNSSKIFAPFFTLFRILFLKKIFPGKVNSAPSTGEYFVYHYGVRGINKRAFTSFSSAYGESDLQKCGKLLTRVLFWF